LGTDHRLLDRFDILLKFRLPVLNDLVVLNQHFVPGVHGGFKKEGQVGNGLFFRGGFGPAPTQGGDIAA
jgi:hypothetical protein